MKKLEKLLYMMIRRDKIYLLIYPINIIQSKKKQDFIFCLKK